MGFLDMDNFKCYKLCKTLELKNKLHFAETAANSSVLMDEREGEKEI